MYELWHAKYISHALSEIRVLLNISNRFVRFVASGGSAAAVEYSTFVVLQTSLGKGWLLFSQPISFAAGFIVSFLLNRSWVFRSSGTVHTELAKYSLMAIMNLIAGDLMIAVLTGAFHLNQFLSKLLVMTIIASWNYVLFSTLVFKPRTDKA